MTKVYFSFSLFLIASFLPAQWQTFVSEKGKFSIHAPGGFVEKVNTVDTPIGETSYHTFLLQTSDEDADNLVYMVSYCDYPEGSIHSDSTELLQEFFEVTVESALKSVNGKLFYSAPIKFGDYPGVMWRIDYNNGEATIKTRSYLVGNRYYALQTVSLKDKGLNPSIDKFMDSFTLIE